MLSFTNIYRIFASKERSREALFGESCRFYHSFVREEVQRCGAQVLTHFGYRACRREEIFLLWRVDSVKVGKNDGRRRDKKVHFLRTGFKKHGDYLSRGRATHDGIIENGNAPACDDFFLHGELCFYALLADVLLGLDKGAVNVAIFGEAHFKRNATRLGVAYCRGYRGLGDRNDDVGRHRGFYRKLAAEIFAHLVDRFADQLAIRPRKIDELKNIELRLGL